MIISSNVSEKSKTKEFQIVKVVSGLVPLVGERDENAYLPKACSVVPLGKDGT